MNSHAPNSYNAELERFDCCGGRICICERDAGLHYHRCYGCAEEIPSLSYHECLDDCPQAPVGGHSVFERRLCSRHIGAREYSPEVKPYTCCDYRRWCVCGNKQAAVDR